MTTTPTYVVPQTPQEWEDDGYADGLQWADSTLDRIHRRIAYVAGQITHGQPVSPYLIGLLRGLARAAMSAAS